MNVHSYHFEMIVWGLTPLHNLNSSIISFCVDFDISLSRVGYVKINFKNSISQKFSNWLFFFFVQYIKMISYSLSMSQCIPFLWQFLQGSVQSKIMDNLFATHQGIERLPLAAYEQHTEHRVVNTNRYHCCTSCQAWIMIFLSLDTIFVEHQADF